jgi:hypothetical protein
MTGGGDVKGSEKVPQQVETYSVTGIEMCWRMGEGFRPQGSNATWGCIVIVKN